VIAGAAKQSVSHISGVNKVKQADRIGLNFPITLFSITHTGLTENAITNVIAGAAKQSVAHVSGELEQSKAG